MLLKKHILYFIFSIGLIVSSCSSTKDVNTSPEIVLIFGNGGGFTGQLVEYVLDDKGTFLMNDKLKEEVTILRTLKKSEIKKIFEEFRSLQFDSINFNHPGNSFYFIKSNKSGSTHEVVWGEADNLPPTQIIQFYDLLISKAR